MIRDQISDITNSSTKVYKNFYYLVAISLTTILIYLVPILLNVRRNTINRNNITSCTIAGLLTILLELCFYILLIKVFHDLINQAL